MKTILVLCALVAVVVSSPADTYNPNYDNFDATQLIENPRVLENYGKCFLGTGPCTREGTDFKRIMPEAIATSCAKCTPKQRHLVRQVVHAFQEKKPVLWTKLVQKEDPNEQYKESFNKFLSETD